MKKNVASQIIGAQMVSASDGSAFTGSVTVYVTGDGGTQAAGSVGSGACTHEGNGFHTYAPAQAETNYDHIGFTFTGTGAIPATVQLYTTFPQTGDSYARLGAPSGASVSADVAAVQSDTNDIQTRLPAALVSGRMDASVGAMAADVLTSSSLAASAVTEIQSGLSTLDAAGVRSAVGLASANLDTQLAAIPTAAANADAVWDEAISGHLSAGTTGAALNAAGSAGDPWSTPLPGAYGAGTAGKIVGDNINATISSRSSQASVDTIDDFLDTEVAAIKAKTDALPSDPADASDIAASFSTVNSTLATIAGYVDTEVAAILAAVDTEVTAIKAKTDNLPASPAATGDIPSAASIADAVWDEATSGHASAGSTGKALSDADQRGARTTLRGTVGIATTPSTTQFTPSALDASMASADQLKGRIIVFDKDTTTAALRGEATDITASSNASLPLLTFTALTTAPASGDTFTVV